MKRLLQKFDGLRYRAFNKIIHAAGLCRPQAHTLLDYVSIDRNHRSIHYKCSWCGLGGSKIISGYQFAQEQNKEYKRTKRQHWLYS